jgi:hypothetical protein
MLKDMGSYFYRDALLVGSVPGGRDSPAAGAPVPELLGALLNPAGSIMDRTSPSPRLPRASRSATRY